MNLPSLSLYSPVFGFVLILLVALAASLWAKIIPFYRRELHIEDVSRLTPLDGLRGILCFAVMCHHSIIIPDYVKNDEWIYPQVEVLRLFGDNSVALFFAVTGFLFWSRAMASEGRIEVWPFLRARLLRIAPLYLFSTFVAIDLAATDIDWHAPDAVRDAIMTMANLGSQRWSSIGGFDIGPINARVMWSMQYE